MADLQKMFVKSYKRRLKQKIDDVAEDANNACAVIQAKTTLLQETVSNLLEEDDRNFLSDYQKIQKDIESLSDKLFVLMRLISSDEEGTENVTEGTNDSSIKVSTSHTSPVNKYELPSCCQLDTNMQENSCVEKHSRILPDIQMHTSGNFRRRVEIIDSMEVSNFDRTPLALPCVTLTESCPSLKFCEVDLLNEVKEHPIDSTHELSNMNSSCLTAAMTVALSGLEDKTSLAADKAICKQNISFGSTVPCFVTKFTSPSDFWIQFDSPAIQNIAEILAVHQLVVIDSTLIENGKYCSAIFEQNEYRRVEILKVFQIEAEVLFVDYGDVKSILCKELMELPDTLYSYPAQAIHCFLNGVVPCRNEWSPEALREFMKLSCYDLQASVLPQRGNLFPVQLTYTSQHLGEACDLSDSLCILELALPIINKMLSAETETSGQQAIANCSSTESFVDTESQIVSTSEDFDLSTVRNILSDLPHDDDPAFKDLATRAQKGFTIHATVPSPQPLLLQDDLIIIMPSFVYSPSYFYAHYSMKKPLELDELREQMTDFYNNLTDDASLILDVRNLKEDMFLACPYEDGFWYRVQVNLICNDEHNENEAEAIVLYVDYGNESSVLVQHLRPLTLEFAKYPSMAILCALAHIIPEDWDLENNVPLHLMKWSKKAIDYFQEMTDDDKALTAQISKFVPLRENRVLYEVFLWDDDIKGERLLNDVLVQEKLAKYIHLDLLPLRLLSKNQQQNFNHSDADVERLEKYDPMSDEFHAVDNSYGVNLSDAEVATTGYKAKDESYICKFHTNQTCYRNPCPYKHAMPSFAGGTQDQEDVYLYENNIQLPETGSYCLVQVSCIVSLTHFYVVFPFGTNPVNEMQRNLGLWNHRQREFELLTVAMYKYYEDSPFNENSTIALAHGTIVAAKTQFDGHWYRARVLEVENVSEPVQVFFIDFGTIECIERQNIREMAPQFLHCPFQAVEAWLANVEPVDLSKGQWDIFQSFLQRFVKGKMLLAYINRRISSTLFVTLTTTSESDRILLNNRLVQEGVVKPSSNCPILCPSEYQLAIGHSNKSQLLLEPG